MSGALGGLSGTERAALPMGTPGRSRSSGAAGGGTDSSSMPVSVVIGSELMPSGAEGAAFPEGPEAAGVNAMAHYRRRRGKGLAEGRIDGVESGLRLGGSFAFSVRRSWDLPKRRGGWSIEEA